jgi:hypothetical protein
MIRVKDINTVEISINDRLAPWDAGRGPTIIELSESSLPPTVNNGILLEDGVSFLMMEDTTSYLLQEA